MDFQTNDIAYAPTTGVRRLHVTPLVAATEESLEGYGTLVADPARSRSRSCAGRRRAGGPSIRIPAIRAASPRDIRVRWIGETLFARNHAVGDSYLFGWSNWPEERGPTGRRDARVGVHLARQLSSRRRAAHLSHDGESFVVPLALPGDDVTPEASPRFGATEHAGLYIHPNVWHGAFVP